MQNIHILNAEPSFLPHLHKLHATFPRLRIVLEHATTRAAVEAVKACGDTVACTITTHHLALTVDDWAGQSWHFCKPVAKYPDDRQALRDVIAEGLCLYNTAKRIMLNSQRTSTLLPRFRFCTPSSAPEIYQYTLVRLCCWHLYFPHLASSDSSPIGIFRCS